MRSVRDVRDEADRALTAALDSEILQAQAGQCASDDPDDP